MQARKIILGVAGIVVLGLVLFLLLSVHSDSRADIPADKRARALAEYERQQRLAAAAVPEPPPPVDRTRRRVVRKKPEPEPEPEPEAPAPRRARPNLAQAAKMGMAAPSIQITQGGGTGDDESKKQMDEVRKAYDTGNYPMAQELSLEAIKKAPRNVKLLRYVVSSSCAVGDVSAASEYIRKLPRRDQKQMRKRCSRWGAEL
jgi:hypothetical protein